MLLVMLVSICSKQISKVYRSVLTETKVSTSESERVVPRCVMETTFLSNSVERLNVRTIQKAR
jgi:hypothetical protein